MGILGSSVAGPPIGTLDEKYTGVKALQTTEFEQKCGSFGDLWSEECCSVKSEQCEDTKLIFQSNQCCSDRKKTAHATRTNCESGSWDIPMDVLSESQMHMLKRDVETIAHSHTLHAAFITHLETGMSSAVNFEDFAIFGADFLAYNYQQGMYRDYANINIAETIKKYEAHSQPFDFKLLEGKSNVVFGLEVEDSTWEPGASKGNKVSVKQKDLSKVYDMLAQQPYIFWQGPGVISILDDKHVYMQTSQNHLANLRDTLSPIHQHWWFPKKKLYLDTSDAVEFFKGPIGDKWKTGPNNPMHHLADADEGGVLILKVSMEMVVPRLTTNPTQAPLNYNLRQTRDGGVWHMEGLEEPTNDPVYIGDYYRFGHMTEKFGGDGALTDQYLVFEIHDDKATDVNVMQMLGSGLFFNLPSNNPLSAPSCGVSPKARSGYTMTPHFARTSLDNRRTFQWSCPTVSFGVIYNEPCVSQDQTAFWTTAVANHLLPECWQENIRFARAQILRGEGMTLAKIETDPVLPFMTPYVNEELETKTLDEFYEYAKEHPCECSSKRTGCSIMTLKQNFGCPASVANGTYDIFDASGRCGCDDFTGGGTICYFIGGPLCTDPPFGSVSFSAWALGGTYSSGDAKCGEALPPSPPSPPSAPPNPPCDNPMTIYSQIDTYASEGGVALKFEGSDWQILASPGQMQNEVMKSIYVCNEAGSNFHIKLIDTYGDGWTNNGGSGMAFYVEDKDENFIPFTVDELPDAGAQNFMYKDSGYESPVIFSDQTPKVASEVFAGLQGNHFTLTFALGSGRRLAQTTTFNPKTHKHVPTKVHVKRPPRPALDYVAKPVA